MESVIQSPQSPPQRSSAFDDDNDDDSDKIYNFLRYKLPKVELHAHLNGCIPSSVLRTLAQERNITLSAEHFSFSDNDNIRNTDEFFSRNRSLQDCFHMFAELPLVINDLCALEQITTAALEQFAYHHHTVYLELRTTPKRLQYNYLSNTSLCSKSEYIQTILRIVQQFEQTDQERYDHECQTLNTNGNGGDPIRLPITCRIIISVDRSQSVVEATENIDLAISLQSQDDTESYVVGVDLGGNPMKQDFALFQSLFHRARMAGLKTTIHCAEVACTNSDVESKERYEEVQRIIQFHPDRLGHCVLLPPDLLQQLDQLQIPVETCPTSNVLTVGMLHDDAAAADDDDHHQHGTDVMSATSMTPRPDFESMSSSQHSNAKQKFRMIRPIINGLRQHHSTMKRWITTNHPIIICTDDPGIFDTNITQELYIVHRAFPSLMTLSKLVQLTEKSMDYAFCSQLMKIKIKDQLQQRCRTIVLNLNYS